MHEATYFLAMVGRVDVPEHTAVKVDNSLGVGEVVEEEHMNNKCMVCGKTLRTATDKAVGECKSCRED